MIMPQVKYSPTKLENHTLEKQQTIRNESTLESHRSRDEEDDIYRKVCENIRHNLSLIRSYTKVTITPDAKAAYLSIVDAALTGPHQLGRSEAVSVLGVSSGYTWCSV